MTEPHSTTTALDELSPYTQGSDTTMALFRYVRGLRGGETPEAPEAPAWCGRALAELLDFEREAKPETPDLLLAVQQRLGRSLQRMAQAALRAARVYHDGDDTVCEAVLLAGFCSLSEQRAFALGRSYAFVAAPGAAEPAPAAGDVLMTSRTRTAWHCAKPCKGPAQ